MDSLKRQHPSRPRNLLIADVCFKAGYIDAWGSGTLKIISTCKETGLPDPEIIEQDGGILVTLYKNKYSADQLQKSGLNERQVKALLYVVENGSITNSQYQQVCNTSERTALRDLEELLGKGVFVKTGLKNGTFYKLADG